MMPEACGDGGMRTPLSSPREVASHRSACFEALFQATRERRGDGRIFVVFYLFFSDLCIENSDLSLSINKLIVKAIEPIFF